jgi:signal transduction histidine kinase
MARIIQRSVALMQQIAQDLLDRTSLDTGRLVLDRQATAISDIIGAAETLFAPVAREHEVEFVVVNGSDLPLIHADPRRLLQILSNLLGNAMKFTPARGRVELSAQWAEMDAGHARTAAGLGVRFQVTDTGPGIPARDLDHIFDWFWHTETPGGSGNGMGLAIAGGLVAAHGARLNVRSEPGHGSAFWFTIPAIGTSAP